MAADESLTGPPVDRGDAADARLIELLQANGRASYAELGGVVGVTGEAVQQRLRRLEQSGRVKVVASVAPEALGYRSAGLIAIDVAAPTSDVARKVATVPQADFVVTTAGSSDIFAELICLDDEEFALTLDAIRALDGVRGCRAFMYLDVELYAYTNGPLTALGRGRMQGAHGPVHVFDETDKAMLQVLREDGRASFADLAEASGLSYASARRRAMRLLESDAVRVDTFVHPILAADRVMACVGLRVDGPLPEVIIELEALDEVGMVLITTGPHDLLIEVTCTGKADLADLIGRRLRQIPGVRGTEAYQYLEVHKLPFSWRGADNALT